MSASRLLIREATRADAEAIAALYVRARAAGAAAGTIPPSVHEEEEVKGWIGGVVLAHRECWVAERTGRIVAMLVLEAEWIDQLYVDPDFTSQGIGSELVATAKRRRPDGLRLWTFVVNRGAQRFYRRHGFVEVQRTDGARNEERAADIQYAWSPAA